MWGRGPAQRKNNLKKKKKKKNSSFASLHPCGGRCCGIHIVVCWDFPVVSVVTGPNFLAVSGITGLDFPAITVVACRDFPSVSAVSDQDFPAVSVVTCLDFPAGSFRLGVSGCSFLAVGDCKKLYGCRANFSGIDSWIFCP